MDHQKLGARELELLRYVTEHAPISVGEVAEQWGMPLGLVRTTVLVMMERLRKKGFLSRHRARNERSYQYAPSQQPSEVMRGLVGEFVERMLGGSLSPFVAYIAERQDLSNEEIADLRRVIAGLEARRSEGP